jgi:integrase/recombinase XerD
LLCWYRAGADVNAKLPLLATYMGHVSIVSTEYYLQFVEPLATLASERFARYWRSRRRTACARRCTMKAESPNTLARALRGFFADHLPCVRGTSPHTLHSYRDTFVLLLRFLADRGRRSVAELDVEDLGPQDVLEFLHHLEAKRGNIAATRNVRLAAIHAFFRYFATEHPERINHCQRVLAVPFKRARSRAVEYLDFPEIQAVLAAIDRTTFGGRRDYALLVTMFNTGARVQEIVTLRVVDLRLASPPHLRLFGKGRKERLCPLWPQTVELLRAFLAERHSPPQGDQPLFLNHRRGPLSRFGVRYILAKYCTQAREAMPTLAAKRLHPHSMRHYLPFLTMSCHALPA